MRTLPRLLAGLVIPLLPLALHAQIPLDNDIKVDIVCDMTDVGKGIEHPTAAHPAYYFPIVKGYDDGTGANSAIIADLPPPPDQNKVLWEVVKALAAQGYQFCGKAHHPSLVLMFWWGYRAPITSSNGGYLSSQNSLGGHAGGGAAGIMSAMESGQVQTNSILNKDTMEELVLGSDYESGFGDTEKNFTSLKMDRLKTMWLAPRYFLMLSAMDFDKAMTKDSKGHPNLVVYWTARVSTELYGHTLAQVLPTLIDKGAGSFGRSTNGPQIIDAGEVPEGTVIVGTPVLKPSAVPAAASHGP